MSDVSEILERIQKGESAAAERLLPLVYDELCKLAATYMVREAPGNTLDATALVHEAHVRLVGPDAARWDNQGHFFAAAATAMRRILIERARRKRRIVHGGGRRRQQLHADLVASYQPRCRLPLIRLNCLAQCKGHASFAASDDPGAGLDSSDPAPGRLNRYGLGGGVHRTLVVTAPSIATKNSKLPPEY
jgi:hypothetical protein